MAGKRKSKRTTQGAEDLSKPSKWRLQHGGFGEPVREADPETGTPVQHRRAVDMLGLMLAHGSTMPQMHEAGCIFRTLFRSAALDGIATSQLIRVAGATTDAVSSRQVDARRRVGKHWTHSAATVARRAPACGSSLGSSSRSASGPRVKAGPVARCTGRWLRASSSQRLGRWRCTSG